MRTEAQVQRNIAGTRLRLRSLKQELQRIRRQRVQNMLDDIDGGMRAKALMAKYDISRGTLASFMHRHCRFFAETPSLKTLTADQRRMYEKMRKADISREDAYRTATQLPPSNHKEPA